MSMSDNKLILELSNYISLEDLGSEYDFRAFNGNRFWKKDNSMYNKYFYDLYHDHKCKELKISQKKLEEIVISDFFDLLTNSDHNHILEDEIKNIPIAQVHVLLPIYNIQITIEKVKIGDYNLIQFQKLGDYIRNNGFILSEIYINDFSNDVYFYNIPFAEITVDARDNEFALETAKQKLQLFICFINYCLFSDIRGTEVASNYTNTGNRDRHYMVSSTSFSSSMSANHIGVKRPDVSDFYDYIVDDKNGYSRLIEIIQKDVLDNELEKRISNAINWIGLSIAENNNAIALTQSTLAVESLLQSQISGEPISKSIVASISETVAFLLGDSFDSRKDWEKRFKIIYGLRSKVAHGKSNDISPYQVLEAIEIAKSVVTQILTNPEIKSAKTIQMINNYIEKMRYTYT